MGAGASASAETIKNASPEEIAAAVKELSPESLSKIKAALGGAFYLVDHTFKEDAKPEEWWAKMGEMMADKAGWSAFFKSNCDKGFYNHAFMPLSQTHTVCIWERKPGTTEEGLQKLLDEVVTQGAMVNKMMQISPELSGGKMPFPEAYAKDSTVSMEGSASFPTKSVWYLIHHDMKEGKAAEWWEGMAKMDAAAQKAFADDCAAKGYYNHCFMPISQQLCYCLWEVKEAGMDEGFQTFLDDVVGRGCMVNTLHAMPAALTGGTAPCKPQLNVE